jgi:uncharacterized Fe-S radical SAM superfamily protein PflX
MSLIAIIGNAVLDPDFRRELLSNPVATAENYGFQITNGEAQELEKLRINRNLASGLSEQMEVVQNTLEKVKICPMRRCAIRKPGQPPAAESTSAAD